MTLSRDQVLHLATLVRIGMSEAEVTRHQDQLSHIIEQFQILEDLDTIGVDPTGHSVTLNTVMREDEVEPSFSKQDILQNAPNQEMDMFRVRVVLDE